MSLIYIILYVYMLQLCVDFDLIKVWLHTLLWYCYSIIGRYWEMVERLRVNQIYVAPTALRLLLKAGDHHVKKYDRSSLTTLGCGK